LQHAKMRKAASKSSPKRKGHAWARRVATDQRVVLERRMAAEHGVNEAVVLRIFM